MSGLSAQVRVERDEFLLNVSIGVANGSTLAVLGPNGAGKTTLLHAIAGLQRIDAGMIALDGVVLDAPPTTFVAPEQRGIGVVFQDYLLFPHLSVLDNVAFGLKAAKRTDADAAARGWLEQCGIDHLSEAKPGSLSGGEAQRVALARALASEPNALVLDEPMAALDVSTRSGVRRLLADHLGTFSGPRLLVTHDPADAFVLADSICIVEDGSITQLGTPQEIRLRPRSAYVAELAGVNHVRGDADGGDVAVDGHMLRVGNTAISGPVIVTVHPRSISLHRQAPEGSPRNAWQTRVSHVEHYGDRVRVEVDAPLTLTAEITPAAVDALGLAVGESVWVSIKATEISVDAD
jgi:molybdate transport system ATP-binding protein